MSNFVFKRGDTFNLNLQLVDVDEALQFPADDVRRAIDLTGFAFNSQVKSLVHARILFREDDGYRSKSFLYVLANICRLD